MQIAGRQSHETQSRRTFCRLNQFDHLSWTKRGFLQNLRKARRGAAGGPSGMRTEHLRPLLDNIEDSNKFYEIAQAFAQAQIPNEILSAIRVGQLTALEKPNGGVRGIVVGDVVRRLIAKTMSDQMMARFETATKPFPIRFINKSWVRKHCTHCAKCHRQLTPGQLCCRLTEWARST